MKNTTWPEPDADVDALATQVIGAAIEVHRALGVGFVESVYREALCLELAAQGIPFERSKRFVVRYRDKVVGGGELDILVGGKLVLELKAVACLIGVHEAQVRNYLKAGGWQLGLLLNFHAELMKEGIRRVPWTRQHQRVRLAFLAPMASLARPAGHLFASAPILAATFFRTAPSPPSHRPRSAGSSTAPGC